MTIPPPDRSRDRRIEDPTNLWIVHPAARLMLPWFVARGISANAVSIAGLALGLSAALAYSHWVAWPYAVVGFLLSISWLIADGLDGMIARATGTASPLGRILDGLCDHGVFIMIYVALAWSIGTAAGWLLACAAGAAHAVQSSLFESERARFHRRCNGAFLASLAGTNPLVRSYDGLGGMLDRFAPLLDDALRHGSDAAGLAQTYGRLAARPLRLMSLLSANVRVIAIFIACLAGNPRLFWWFELVVLSVILAIALAWHRAVEGRLMATMQPPFPTDPSSPRRI